MADDERPDDPFEDLTLDEDFVRGAEIVEESADARLARLARIDAEHKRLAAEREVERAALDKSLRRRARRQRRAARGNEHRQRLVVIAVMLAIFGGLVYWNARNGGSQVTLGGSGLLGSDMRSGSVQSSGRPPAGVDEQPEPLGSPPPVARESSSFAFLQKQPGSDAPVAYDPCRPIHVVINERTVIVGGNQIVQDALNAVSRATGLHFVVDGLTDEVPSDGRESYQPDRYQDRWAPVLIAWSDPSETPELAGDVQGIGGSSALSNGKKSVYVSGGIELDGPGLAEFLAVPGGVDEIRAVVEHELGHLVGLDHVNDTSELMNPVGGTVTTYADGDLTGLSRLGNGECFPDV